jgi:hypothetical protein
MNPPMNITGGIDRPPLPPPTVVAPKKEDVFPSYGKVRLAWLPVSGARAYRFTLWNEAKLREAKRKKIEAIPRWTTEVKQTWLEVTDAPYSSYMYLEAALWRWDIAAVDAETGQTGQVATNYFRTSSQEFLHRDEKVLRLEYRFTPSMTYEQSSSATGTNGLYSSTSSHLAIDGDWWIGRAWGFSAGAGVETLALPMISGTTAFTHFNFDALFRVHLSPSPWGWSLAMALGGAIQTLPQLEIVDSSVGVSNLVGIGPHLQLRLNYDLRDPSKPWQAQIVGTLFPPLVTQGGSASSNVNLQTMDADISARLMRQFTQRTSVGLGVTGQTKGVRYIPDAALANSVVRISGWAISLMAQFDYFRNEETTTSAQMWQPQ